jgi:hypothetical protein
MRWVLAVVVAVCAGMAGSLAGGLIMSVTRNQSLMNTASAFVGTLALVYVGSRVAPAPGRASKIFASIIIVIAVLALAAAILNPVIAAEEGLIIGQPLGQIGGATLAFMLIRAHLGAAPTALGKGLGGLLMVGGMLLSAGSGLYTAFLTVALYGAIWGPIGVVAVFVLPPMWVAAPFVLWWISGGFPVVYFLAWLGTWVGMIIAGAGSSLTEKTSGLSPVDAAIAET